jgi:hypothetical protein
MMTFSAPEIAGYLRARKHADQLALIVLRKLEARGCVAGTDARRIRTPTALAQRCCDRAGVKINTISAGTLAEIMWPTR